MLKKLEKLNINQKILLVLTTISTVSIVFLIILHYNYTWFILLLALSNVVSIKIIINLTKDIEQKEYLQKRIEIIIDNAPFACFLLDENMNVLQINKKLISIFGIFENLVFSIDIPEEKLNKIKEKNSKSITYEWTHYDKDKIEIPTRVTLANESGNILGYIEDLRDIRVVMDVANSLEEKAYTCSLTGANNRLCFEESAQDYFTTSLENRNSFSIIMLDIDDFKKINDTHGHLLGDEVLKSLCKRVYEIIDSENFFYRLGGEEFVVILPNYSQQESHQIAKIIKNNIIQNPFSVPSPLGYNLDINVTVSFGIASTDTPNCKTLNSLLDNADKALYHVKHNGKNNICVYSNLL